MVKYTIYVMSISAIVPGEEQIGGTMDNRRMKEIPADKRPYERCVRMGPEALSDEELLSIIIRTGSRGQNSLETARRILDLSHPNDGILGLSHLSLQDLTGVDGIGTVKGIQLLCIGELSRRISKRHAISHIQTFDLPEEVVNYYMEDMRLMEQEQLFAMFLDMKHRLIKDMLISKGTANAAIISPREIFIEALRCRATGVILVHNHPSGDPTPSRQDCLMTARIREAGNLLGIQLLDHVVIGDHVYCSFKREGKL